MRIVIIPEFVAEVASLFTFSVIRDTNLLHSNATCSYLISLLSELAGIRPVDRVISWGIGRDRVGAGIRLPGHAVPITQGPTPPARR